MTAKSSWIKKGDAALGAIAQAEKEAAERKEKGYAPFRFWLKKGEECPVIILDHAFVADETGEGGALIREHNLKDSQGKWGNFESCCADFAPCPLCDKAGTDGFGPSTLVVMLSVLVLREWTNKKTGEKHAYTRMLLPIKMGMKEKFLELQKHAFREQGTMRGLYLVLKRGMDDQSISTGEPIMLDNGKLYDLVSEEELVEDYGHPELRNREKKVIKAANADLEPYVYEDLFPEPDPDDLAKRFGGRALAGSRRANAAEKWEQDEDEQAPAAAAAPAARSRTRGAAAPEPTAASTPARRRGAAPAAAEPAPASNRARNRSAKNVDNGGEEAAW